MGTIRLPGMIDAHVHLREPGGTHKENVVSGTAAALAGGVIGVLEMPNTKPATMDRTGLGLKHETYRSKSRCDFGLFLGSDGKNLDALVELGGSVAGLKLYLDNTYGDLQIRDLELLEPIWRCWPGPGPICVHAETIESISQAISLTDRYSQALHVCHVSRREHLQAILLAKEQGLPVTCEVTPHHLFLTEQDSVRLGPFGMMKPSLGSASDRDALWQHLGDVDCIATDHAPHSREEKLGAHPPPGVPGLETVLPLLLTAVHEGRLELSRLVELVHDSPLRIFPITPPSSSWIEIDPDERYQLSSEGLHTRCHWTPFDGTWVVGRVMRTWIRGRITFESGEVSAEPGWGQDMVARVSAGSK